MRKLPLPLPPTDVAKDRRRVPQAVSEEDTSWNKLRTSADSWRYIAVCTNRVTSFEPDAKGRLEKLSWRRDGGTRWYGAKLAETDVYWSNGALCSRNRFVGPSLCAAAVIRNNSPSIQWAARSVWIKHRRAPLFLTRVPRNNSPYFWIAFSNRNWWQLAIQTRVRRRALQVTDNVWSLPWNFEGLAILHCLLRTVSLLLHFQVGHE
jgi:hypothetical protein